MVDDSNATRASLIARIGAGDEEAWREWVAIYMPAIEKWARYWVRPGDVEDVTSDVIEKVFKGAKTFVYDKEKGRYRDYLKKVSYSAAMDWLNKESHQPKTNGQTDGLDPMAQVVDEAAKDLLESLEKCDQLTLLGDAQQRTRNESNEQDWQSFHQSVYLDRKPLEIAASLGIKVGTYYASKSRFLAKLAKNFKELDQ